MHILVIVFSIVMIFLVNPVIAFLNAKNVGYNWISIGNTTTWEKCVLVSGLVQSVIGYTIPVFGILLGIGYISHLLTNNQLFLSVDLMWISIIVPIVGTGIVITIQSVKDAIQDRSFGNIAIAVWNVGSTIENLFDLFSNFGGIIGDINKRSDDENGSGLLIVISIVMIALCSGMVLTGLTFRYGQKMALT